MNETTPVVRITEDDPLTLDEQYREIEFASLPEWSRLLWHWRIT